MSQKTILQAISNKPMLITLLMGFASGLPFLLTLRTLQAWMTDAGVNLKTVGIFSLVGLPYTLKFVWAPVMDRFSLSGLGRRRSWLLITQVGLVVSLAGMSLIQPREEILLMGFLALIVSFFSASQDIVIDAYRRETLPDQDLGFGSTFYYYGYRIAMWVSGALALGMAEYISWKYVYLLMAAVMASMMGVSFWADEPTGDFPKPKSLREAVIDPFLEFLGRPGSLLILSFVLFYKLGDVMAGNMLTPFYLKLGYSKIEIAAIAKTMSLPVTIVGGFIGATLVHKWGIIRSLWVFGALQMIATFGFNLLLLTDHNLWALGAVIIGEDFATSLATSSFLAFMASMTNKKFTATQYALLTSLTGIPRVILSSPTGYIVESVGWFAFFSVCTVIAIPGMLLIRKVSKLTAGPANEEQT